MNFSGGVEFDMIKLIQIAEKHGEMKDYLAAYMATCGALITCSAEERLKKLWEEHKDDV